MTHLTLRSSLCKFIQTLERINLNNFRIRNFLPIGLFHVLRFSREEITAEQFAENTKFKQAGLAIVTIDM